MIIDPSKWRVTLPVYPPEAVIDNSIDQAHASCPTYGFYRYGLRRGFEGKSWAIQFGTAYHRFREVIEKKMQESGVEGMAALTTEIVTAALGSALIGWEDPPVEHRHAHLTQIRLVDACYKSVMRVMEERRSGRIIVTRSEDSFDLEFSWWLCPSCYHTEIRENLTHLICPRCDDAQMFHPRHGGRVDQFTIFTSLNNARMIRDFKTTGMMGKTYNEKFDPNGQIQGYVWCGTQLSGREFDGALIETVYNTKKEGPTIHQHYVQYTKGQIERWEASRMIERQMLMQMYSRIPELGFLAFPQRTNNCNSYGGCPFREPCRASSGFEIENWLKNYTIESHWDFLAPMDEESEI